MIEGLIERTPLQYLQQVYRLHRWRIHMADGSMEFIITRSAFQDIQEALRERQKGRRREYVGAVHCLVGRHPNRGRIVQGPDCWLTIVGGTGENGEMAKR